MASTLMISTGALSGSLTSEDDAAAQNVLLNFAKAIGVPDEETPQVKLDAILVYLAAHMADAARERWFQEQSAQLREEAEENVHW